MFIRYFIKGSKMSVFFIKIKGRAHVCFLTIFMFLMPIFVFAASSGKMSKKDQYHQEILDSVSQSVGVDIKESITYCRSSIDTSACKSKYPFKILHQSEWKQSIESCISSEMLSCLATDITHTDDHPQSVDALKDNVQQDNKDTKSLSKKEQLQQTIMTDVAKNIGDLLKTVVTTCRTNLDTTSCQKQHPFKLFHQEQWKSSLGECITNDMLSCISTSSKAAVSSQAGKNEK